MRIHDRTIGSSRRALTATIFVVSAVTLVASTGSARADTDVKTLLATAQDSSADANERANALVQLRNFALNKNNDSRSDPIKKALEPILAELASKRADEKYERLIQIAFKALDPFRPFPDMGSIVRPYLAKDASREVRLAALLAIGQHGAQGILKEMLAIFDEETKKRDRERESFENRVIEATVGLPGADAGKVLEAALQHTKSKGIRLIAIRWLGEMVSHRPASELNSSVTTPMLLELSKATNPDQEVACAAALSLLRWGSYDGIAEVMQRVDKRGGTTLVYSTICEAARKTKGFLDVSPLQYQQVPQAKRDEVVKAMNAWWEKAKGSRPEAALLEALAAAGVSVPKDTSSRDVVSALIDGLSLDSRTLRYASLDMLVRKTGRADMAADFKMYKQASAGDQIVVTMPEPDDGFPEGDKRAVELFQQQKEKAKAWRAWWDKNGPQATLVNGVWTAPK
jgi:hypothetical protein